MWNSVVYIWKLYNIVHRQGPNFFKSKQESKETTIRQNSECIENTNSKKQSPVYLAQKERKEKEKWVISATNPHTRYGASPSSTKLNGIIAKLILFLN